MDGNDPIIIVGDGLGGLATALALARRGWPVRVIEGAPEFGAGSGTVLASSEYEAAQKKRSRQSGRAPLVHGQRELLRAWAYSARFHTSSAFPPDEVRATPKVKSSPASLMIDHF